MWFSFSFLLVVFILAVLGLHFCVDFALVAVSRGCSLGGVLRMRASVYGARVLGRLGSVLWACRLRSCDSWALAPKPSRCGAWA